MSNMKLILTQDVRNLGHKDDVVAVKAGYGRNFLIPKGMGKLATESALKMLAEDIKQRAFKQDKVKKDAEALSTKLEGVKVTIKAKATQKRSEARHGVEKTQLELKMLLFFG